MADNNAEEFFGQPTEDAAQPNREELIAEQVNFIADVLNRALNSSHNSDFDSLVLGCKELLRYLAGKEFKAVRAQAVNLLEQAQTNASDSEQLRNRLRQFKEQFLTLKLDLKPAKSILDTYSRRMRKRDAATQEAPHVFWLSRDEAYGAELKHALENYGFTISSFSRFRHMKAALAGGIKPCATIVDTLDKNGKVIEIRRIEKFLRSRPNGEPSIFLCPEGRNINVWLDVIRSGADAFLTRPVNVESLVNKLDSLTHSDTADPYRILMIEDDRVTAFHARHYLERMGMKIQTISGGFTMLETLENFRPDLILMDYYLGHCTGLELAKIIRQHDSFVSIPIVYLSAESEIETQLETLRQGGDDYILKPVRHSHLYTTLVSRIKRARQLRSYMTRDSLTSLYNHTALFDQLKLEIQRAHRAKSSLAFAMVDLDYFKKVNDHHGHLVGDVVLKSLATFLRRKLRRGDVIGRYGGEEFGIILPNTDEATALKIMDRIRSDFFLNEFDSEKGKFKVSFSCGIACYPKVGNFSELAAAADKALYRAKKEGRNQVARHSAESEDPQPAKRKGRP